ncbi:hypothetical protein HNR23_001725 [Nocardiopsis mwathae]|uniref:Uncharacterized protein n=1 Tax=Nocardiopsis mwathae TaxID=1472723 RepID=A0A7X0D4Z8_9ACTN|nr:hypothetical protein [Nocardiopsis mwathae]MBB6171665.1 hypothetical protein [Nocardiopsis mwathae]
MFQTSARIWALITLALGALLLSAAPSSDRIHPQLPLNDADLDNLADIADSFDDWLISTGEDRGRLVYEAEHLATGVTVSARTLEIFRLLLDRTSRGLADVVPPSERVRPFVLAHHYEQSVADARHEASLAAIAHKAEQDELAERWLGAGGDR